MGSNSYLDDLNDGNGDKYYSVSEFSDLYAGLVDDFFLCSTSI